MSCALWLPSSSASWSSWTAGIVSGTSSSRDYQRKRPSMMPWTTRASIAKVMEVIGAEGVFLDRILVITAINRNGHKLERPQTGMATNRNGHKPEQPQTETGHRQELPQTGTATNWSGHKPERPQIQMDTSISDSSGNNFVCSIEVSN